MTLSDHKGKQIIRDSIQKCFLQDFQTMLIREIHVIKVGKYRNKSQTGSSLSLLSNLDTLTL
jgi:hypothetical protein